MKISNKKSSLYKPSIQRDMSYDNIKSLTIDETIESKSEQNSSQQSSLKSLLSKKFHSNNTTMTQPTKLDIKQKKRRTSFRQFSQFLKRSHSTNTDLSTIVKTDASNHNKDQQQDKLTADFIYQQLQTKHIDDHDLSFITRSNTNMMCNSNVTALVPISEEENPLPIKQQTRLTTADIGDEDYYYDNTILSNNGALTHQQTQRLAPSLSKIIHEKYKF